MGMGRVPDGWPPSSLHELVARIPDRTSEPTFTFALKLELEPRGVLLRRGHRQDPRPHGQDPGVVALQQ